MNNEKLIIENIKSCLDKLNNNVKKLYKTHKLRIRLSLNVITYKDNDKWDYYPKYFIKIKKPNKSTNTERE